MDTVESTMQRYPLLISSILEHGASVYPTSTVATFDGEACRRATFADVAQRARRLAAALRTLGVSNGTRVGTFCWNTQEHLEAYLAVPSMGAVLHTLNIRLFTDQLTYVANHAGDFAIIVDDSLTPLLGKVLPELSTVKHLIVVGDGDVTALGDRLPVYRYDSLVSETDPDELRQWPSLDEHSAAAMCYTSGTTGNPKGVAYSHRSSYLHSMAVCMAGSLGITESDRVLPIVPMFHANAWGLPYAAWMAGADFVMPGRFLQPEPLAALIAAERPTMAGAVPTIWNDLLHFADERGNVDLSSFRLVACGGSAVPRSLMEAFESRYGMRIIQAWGMTETSPIGAVAHPPKGTDPADEMEWRSKTGRVVAGVDLRIVADNGEALARDGQSVGEIEVRGAWITASYFEDDSDEASAKFHDGWLRTGDVGTVDELGFVQITDRAKDVIKSGGEWISSVELENHVMSHPQVREAAVIAVPDDRWDERPLVCVVRTEGSSASVEELRDHLAERVAKWWVPERWSLIDEVPKTSVGKFDKKVLRARYADGELDVATL